MSAIASKLFEGLKSVGSAMQAAAPGLGNLTQDVSLEARRLGTQGAMELASALFSGNGFVPYGPGQYTPSATQEQAEPSKAMDSRGIER